MKEILRRYFGRDVPCYRYEPVRIGIGYILLQDGRGGTYIEFIWK